MNIYQELQFGRFYFSSQNGMIYNKIHSMKVLLLLGLCLISAIAQSNLYKLVLHSKDRGAACLDGSPAGMYIHEGSGENKNNYMIFFEGGGFCGADGLSATIQSCYKRSFTDLGSTKSYPSEQNLDPYGILSTDPKVNEVFYDWTKVFVIYCDGSEHIGSRKEPISYKDQKLYFRATNNSLEQFYYLDKNYDMYNGGKIVLTGISAGGMATFEWGQFLYTQTKKAKVYLMPDSGLFLTDYYSPLREQKTLRVLATDLMKLVIQDGQDVLPVPMQKCMEEYDQDIVFCCNAEKYAKHIEAPILMIQSPYDEWSLKNNLGVKCLTNHDAPFSLDSCEENVRKAVEDYRLEEIEAIKRVKAGRKNVGVWGPACVQHGFAAYPSYDNDGYRVPTKTGTKLQQSIKQFLQNPEGQNWNLDEIPWPENTGCDGRTHVNLQTQ